MKQVSPLFRGYCSSSAQPAGRPHMQGTGLDAHRIMRCDGDRIEPRLQSGFDQTNMSICSWNLLHPVNMINFHLTEL